MRPVLDHRIIEVFDIDSKFLMHYKDVHPFVDKFISALNLRVLKSAFYNFKPYGVTMMYVLSSSHLVVHTWPENNYLHIDILQCSKNKHSMAPIARKIFPGRVAEKKI